MPVPKKVSAVAFVEPVRANQTANAFYALDQDGDRWVAKMQADTGWEEVAAESISWSLAMALGVSVPAAGTTGDQALDTLVWLSGYVENTCHWSPVFGSQVEANDLAAMLVLDALVMNPDRHANNVLVETRLDSTKKVWAIDHGQAWVVMPEFIEKPATEPPSVRNLARGLYGGEVRECLSTVCQRARSLADHPDIDGWVNYAASLTNGFGRNVAPGAVTVALRARLQSVEELVQNYWRKVIGKP